MHIGVFAGFFDCSVTWDQEPARGTLESSKRKKCQRKYLKKKSVNYNEFYCLAPTIMTWLPVQQYGSLIEPQNCGGMELKILCGF